MSSDEQLETVDEAADELEQAGENVGDRTVWFARGYVVLLLLIIVGAAAALVWTGVVEVGSLVVGGEVQVGTAAEWLVQGLVLLFLIFTGAAVLISFPFNFWARLLSTVARIADAYELPGDEDGGRE